MELSIVMPCLNEGETLGLCIKKIKKNLKILNISSEIIVADNGSSDQSILIANKQKVKIVHVKKKGYGSALKLGIFHAKGKYILFADADCSYDFNLIPKFYKEISKGYDLVQGCRLPKYGGKIKPGAMPILHRYLGNPFLSTVAKAFHQLPFNDIYCGMRIFRKKIYKNTKIVSDGMVFAIEHLIKTCLITKKVKEIPITLHKDKRIKNKSHLKTFSDGFESLKFLLIFLPKIIFFIPSIIISLIALYFVIQISSFESILNFQMNFTIFISILLFFLSYQIMLFGIASKFIASEIGFSLKNENYFFKIFKLRYAIFATIFLLALALIMNFINFSFISEKIRVLLTILLVYFSTINLINSIMISLIEFLSKKNNYN
jgi:glycosyltransferase involved in cell wall biosynthesis